MVTCASFSASANVAADTGGPGGGPVPDVGGGPAGRRGRGVVGVVEEPAGGPLCGSLLHANAAASAPMGAVTRNCLRVFIVTGAIIVRPHPVPSRRPQHKLWPGGQLLTQFWTGEGQSWDWRN